MIDWVTGQDWTWIVGCCIGVLLGLFVVGAVFYGLAWCVCEVGAKRWEAEGIVLGKDYEPDTEQTSSVPVVTGNGVGVGVVTTGHSESWSTIIEVDGTVYAFNNLTIYHKAKRGDKLRVKMKHNALSGTSLASAWPPQ